MSDPDPRVFLRMLVDALRLEALPTDDQIAVLPDFVPAPDEIANLYHDAWVLVPQIHDAGLITDEQRNLLALLDRLHTEMENAHDADQLWTVDGLRRDARWAEVRQLAGEALAALGFPPGPPEFRGITWVPAGDS